MNSRDSDKKQEKYVEASTGVPVYISGSALELALANRLVMSKAKWMEWRTKETPIQSLKITDSKTLEALHKKYQSLNEKIVPHSSNPNTSLKQSASPISRPKRHPKTRQPIIQTTQQPATTKRQKEITTAKAEKTHQKNPTSYKTLLETLLSAEMIDPNVYGCLTPVDPVKVVEPTEYSSYLNTTDLKVKDNEILDLLNEQEPLESTIDITAPAEADYDNLDLMWFGSSQPNASDDEFSCSREMADEIKSLYN